MSGQLTIAVRVALSCSVLDVVGLISLFHKSFGNQGAVFARGRIRRVEIGQVSKKGMTSSVMGPAEQKCGAMKLACLAAEPAVQLIGWCYKRCGASGGSGLSGSHLAVCVG